MITIHPTVSTMVRTESRRFIDCEDNQSENDLSDSNNFSDIEEIEEMKPNPRFA